jgi:hypothetical protein
MPYLVEEHSQFERLAGTCSNVWMAAAPDPQPDPLVEGKPAKTMDRCAELQQALSFSSALLALERCRLAD